MAPDLEREVHQALRRLPLPRAPRSLTPRVMAAVRARRDAPWYARPMATWPLGLRALVTGLAVVPLTVLGLWLSGDGMLQKTAGAFGLPASVSWTGLLPPSVQQVAQQSWVALVLWRVLFGPALLYAAAFAVAVGCVFAVCAAALTRVVLGRVPA